MNILVITEESGVKLPKIHKWSGKYGRGRDISKNTKIITELEKHGLEVPSDDLELEKQYKIALSDYIRPSKDMFCGTFGEVRFFTEEIRNLSPTELYFISSRYGLLGEDVEIIPYSHSVKKIEDLKKLDEKTNFSGKMLHLAEDYELILLLLSSHFISYLLHINWFTKLNSKIDEKAIIIVSSKKLEPYFSEYNNITLLERKGVTRIGIQNRKDISKKIKIILGN